MTTRGETAKDLATENCWKVMENAIHAPHAWEKMDGSGRWCNGLDDSARWDRMRNDLQTGERVDQAAEFLSTPGTIETPAADRATKRTARTTKAQLDEMIVDLVHEVHVITRRFEAHRKTALAEDQSARSIRADLEVARTKLATVRMELGQTKRELSIMTVGRNKWKSDWEALDKHLRRANARHRKDKRRIKALVNALAGLR